MKMKLNMIPPLAWLGVLAAAVGCGEVCEGNYVITDALELAHMSGCREVTGDLEIRVSGNVEAPIDLYALREVGGHFVLAASSFERLTGLEGLTDVGGRVLIHHNPGLNHLDELAGLRTARHLAIEDNGFLVRVDGFDQLRTTGDLLIRNNPNLKRVSGFARLAQTTGKVVIEAGETIEGFGQLARTDGSVTLWANARPNIDEDSVTGFSQLRSLGDDPAAELRIVTAQVDGFDALGPDWGHGLHVQAQRVLGLEGLETVAGSAYVELTVPTNQARDARAGLFFADTLREVGGDLIIRGPPDLDLTPFNQVERVGGQIQLGGGTGIDAPGRWPALITAGSLVINVSERAGPIEGFYLLEHLGALTIRPFEGAAPADLTSIEGFNALAVVDGLMRISHLPALERIDGFWSLVSVGAQHPDESEKGSLWLRFLPALKVLAGMTQLQRVGHTLSLRDLGLVELPAWPALSVGTLTVQHTEVAALPAWPAMTQLDSLSVGYNPQLSSLGLSGLQAVTTEVQVVQNPVLSCDDVEALLDGFTGAPAETYVSSNQDGCVVFPP